MINFKKAPIASRIRWTCSLYLEDKLGWIEGFSKGSDIPLTEKQYVSALEYLEDNCSKTFIKNSSSYSSYLIHGSGVYIAVHQYNGKFDFKVNTLSFFSTTSKKIFNLAGKIRLPLNSFVEKEDSLARLKSVKS